VNKFRCWLICLLLLSGIISGQSVTVIKTEQVRSAGTADLMVAAVSPSGDKLLVTKPGYTGLKVIDLNGQPIREITSQAGAGYEPKFSADGKTVYFRSDVYSEMKKYSSLHKHFLITGETELLEERVRDLTSPVVAGQKIIWSADGKKKSSSTAPADLKNDENIPYILLQELIPHLYSHGKSRALTPNGKGYYIWASLSPDKARLLYNFNGTGTFICDTLGNILASAGRLNSPSWLNNSIIIGMDDRDDGSRTISSDIIAFVPETGERINLTATPGIIEMYPVPFPDGKRVAYQSASGGIFIMNLKFKQ
jgi:Tol biopolymer transport system component